MKRVFYKLIWCRNRLLCTTFIDTICIKFRISFGIDYNQKQMCDVFLNDWIVSFRFILVFVLLLFFKWSFILTNNVRVLWARTLLFLFYIINMPFSRFVEFFHYSKMQLCTQYVDRIRTSVVDSIQLPFDKIKKKRNITNFSLHSFFLTGFVYVYEWMISKGSNGNSRWCCCYYYYYSILNNKYNSVNNLLQVSAHAIILHRYA